MITGFVGSQDKLKTKSNKYVGGRWCKTHPTGFWGKKSDGTWFDTCTKGYRDPKSKCEIGGE